MGLHIKAKLRGALERQQNRRYACRLAGAKRRVSYEEWGRPMDRGKILIARVFCPEDRKTSCRRRAIPGL
jgi:hypothetical protein